MQAGPGGTSGSGFAGKPAGSRRALSVGAARQRSKASPIDLRVVCYAGLAPAVQQLFPRVWRPLVRPSHNVAKSCGSNSRADGDDPQLLPPCQSGRQCERWLADGSAVVEGDFPVRAKQGAGAAPRPLPPPAPFSRPTLERAPWPLHERREPSAGSRSTALYQSEQQAVRITSFVTPGRVPPAPHRSGPLIAIWAVQVNPHRHQLVCLKRAPSSE